MSQSLPTAVHGPVAPSLHSVVVFMDLVRELSVEAVQKWEALSQVKQLEVASDLLPDVEQVQYYPYT